MLTTFALFITASVINFWLWYAIISAAPWLIIGFIVVMAIGMMVQK